MLEKPRTIVLDETAIHTTVLDQKYGKTIIKMARSEPQYHKPQ